MIDICIATYRRPELLTQLLSSLSGQVAPAGTAFNVTIVDNDPDQAAYPVYLSCRAAMPFRLQYFLEVEPGVAAARNRALRETYGDAIAFLDDDEYVSKTWLAEMVTTLKNTKADVVFGRVVADLPDDAPGWAREHPTFVRPRRKTGTAVDTGPTSNVLLLRAAIQRPHLEFDLAYGLTGGEDTDFFWRMNLAGKRMIWCDEAIAFEVVPPKRLTKRWVYARAFRSGQCHARVHNQYRTSAQKCSRILVNVAKCTLGCLLVPLASCVSEATRVRLSTRIFAALGEATVLLGSSRHLKSYGQQ